MCIRDRSKEDRQVLGIADGERVVGAVIGDVNPDGPADKAGLARGDIILAFEGQPIERFGQLPWFASTAGVGRSVTLRVQRMGCLLYTSASPLVVAASAILGRIGSPDEV